jgi:hypothetical protein
MEKTLLAQRLESARNAIVANAVNTGELIGTYAKAMGETFDMKLENGEIVKWFNLKGKAKAGVKAEYNLFVEALKSAGLEGNKYVYWQRVKEADGYVTAGNTVKATLTIDARNLADLKTILGRIINNESDDDEGCYKSQKAKADLVMAFEILGGNITEI